MADTSLWLDPDRLSRLVALGYEAPGHGVSPRGNEAWRAFVAEAAEACDCQLAVVENYDPLHPGASFIAAGGLDGFDEVFTVSRPRGPTDTYWVAMHDQPSGTVRLGSEIVQPEVMRGTEVYSSVAGPWQLEHFLMGAIQTGPDGVAFFTLARTSRERPFRDGDKTLVSRMLLGHLDRSLTVHREVAAMRDANTMLAAVMNQAPTGLVVLDWHGRVAVVNPTALAILTAGDGLSLVNGELRAQCARAQAQLSMALSAMLQVARGRPAPAPATVLVTRQAATQPYRVSFATLGSLGEGHELPSGSAVVAVIHEEHRVSGQSVTALFRATYGLTRAEVGLCEGLLAGRSLAETAEALNVSRNTAKTHLARVFDKTGVRSQMALLRLLTLGARG